MTTTNTPITIPYSLLLSSDSSIPSLLQQAFSTSPTALGLLLITDLPPAFAAKREKLLHLANAFASLPEPVREEYADPGSSYSFGWSLGKEVMNGKPDRFKGSYYNNPTSDVGDGDTHNIWPRPGVCEGFEPAFKDLCHDMVEVGKILARECDRFVGLEGGLEEGCSGKSIEALIGESRNSKARLLHYFPSKDQCLSLSPPSSSSTDSSTTKPPDDAWCGTHVDLSLLTALCPALFLFHPAPYVDEQGNTVQLEPVAIPSPSPEAGLFIETRGGVRVKAPFPDNCLAFQTGETLSLLTSSRLAATPHFVSSSISHLSPSALSAIHLHKTRDARWEKVTEGTVSRETLAVFLQPNRGEVISPRGETFGEFFKRNIESHY